MKKIVFLLFVFIMIVNHLNAQTKAENLCVKASAQVYENPAKIQLYWPLDSKAQYYIISKKAKDATTWGPAYANIPGTSTSFTDSNIETGKTYEYKIYKNTGIGNPTGVAYIYSGINIPETTKRGTVLVLIDSILSQYTEHLSNLKYDLIGDGWKVKFRFIQRSSSVTDVKNLIVAECNSDKDINTLYLLGRIAVPYSGNLNPDAHPDHQGAWPADVFYADLDGTWTDNSINNSVASRNENKNVPGDGKFDQSAIPSPVDLCMGRVDLFNMKQFSVGDTVLIRKYLEKNHSYRQGNFLTLERGLIDDNFQSYDEGFSQTGWRNFSAFFGSDSIATKDYFGTLSSNNYLWTYGCGGGSYTSCSGIGNTSNFSTNNVNSVFTILFGSYFGDWDSENNFLRAPLAANGQVLTSFWAGRPNWHIHHMALGECIGYSTKLTQNNTSLYTTGYGAGWIHIALMGDPTLRMHIVDPPKNLVADSIGNVTVKLSWSASDDPEIEGYNIYRSKNLHSDFEKINSSPVTTSTFIDNLSDDGKNIYMVRAVKLQKSASGTYYNLSQGIFDSVSTRWRTNIENQTTQKIVSVFPNPSNGNFTLFLKNFDSEYYTVTISNSVGQVVFTAENRCKNNIEYQKLQLAHLENGIYFVEIKNLNKIILQKIIINK